MSEKRLNDELAAIEAALGSLTPVPSGVSRNRLMYLAGRASALRRSRSAAAWLWPCAMTASLLVAATFGTLWATGGRPEVVERVVCVSAESVSAAFDFPPVAASSPSPWANRRLCQLVLEKGINALPQPNIGSAPNTPARRRQESNRDLLNQLLKGSTI